MKKLWLILSAIVMSFSLISYGMDHPDMWFGSQNAFEAYAEQTATDVYETMNTNVTFAEIPNTESEHWEIHELVAKKVFVKKRGVPLSVALRHLLKASSNTRFECGMAQTVFFWRVLLASEFELDALIQGLENSDPHFFFPLILTDTLAVFEYQSAYYGFAHRTGPFTLKMLDGSVVVVDMQNEHNKLVRFRENLERFPKLKYMLSATKQNNTHRTCEASLGGMAYLPNVAGVTGVAKGENLVRVHSETGNLYYGFGPLFADGPKRLPEIAAALEKSAGDKYETEMKELRAIGTIGKTDESCHALQYLIEAQNCNYFDLAKVRTEMAQSKVALKIVETTACSKMDAKVSTTACQQCGKDNAPSICGRCKEAHYCNKECQTAHWKSGHKTACKEKK